MRASRTSASFLQGCSARRALYILFTVLAGACVGCGGSGKGRATSAASPASVNDAQAGSPSAEGALAPAPAVEARPAAKAAKCEAGYGWNGKTCRRHCSSGYAYYKPDCECFPVASHLQAVFSEAEHAATMRARVARAKAKAAMEEARTAKQPGKTEQRPGSFGYGTDAPEEIDTCRNNYLGDHIYPEEGRGAGVDIERAGALTVDLVRPGLLDIARQLDACYATQPPESTERVVHRAQLVVGADGAAQRAQVDGPGGALRECLRRELRRFRIEREQLGSEAALTPQTIELSLHFGATYGHSFHRPAIPKPAPRPPSPVVRTSVEVRSSKGNGGYEAVVSRIMRQNHGRLRRCYEQQLKTHPGFEGTVVSQFRIRRNGEVTDVKQHKTNKAGNDALTQCVIASHRGVSLPRPPVREAEVVVRIQMSMKE